MTTTDGEAPHRQPLPPPTVFRSVWANLFALLAFHVAAGLILWLAWYANSH